MYVTHKAAADRQHREHRAHSRDRADSTHTEHSRAQTEHTAQQTEREKAKKSSKARHIFGSFENSSFSIGPNLTEEGSSDTWVKHNTFLSSKT